MSSSWNLSCRSASMQCFMDDMHQLFLPGKYSVGLRLGENSTSV